MFYLLQPILHSILSHLKCDEYVESIIYQVFTNWVKLMHSFSSDIFSRLRFVSQTVILSWTLLVFMNNMSLSVTFDDPLSSFQVEVPTWIFKYICLFDPQYVVCYATIHSRKIGCSATWDNEEMSSLTKRTISKNEQIFPAYLLSEAVCWKRRWL